MSKLLLITDAWTPQINGVVTTLKNIIAEAEKDNWTVDVIHPDMFKTIKLYSDIQIAIPWGFIDFIKQFPEHHIHICTEGPLGILANLWCRYNNITFTTGYHTKWPEYLYELCKFPKKYNQLVIG